MLKHASNASGSSSGGVAATSTAATTALNGQLLRSSNNNNSNNAPSMTTTGQIAATTTTTVTSTTSTPTLTATAVANMAPARSTHLRPPQPQPQPVQQHSQSQPLNISVLNASLLQTSTSPALLNGGGRIGNTSNLLHIAGPALTPMKPLTPVMTPNGNMHHHDIYTNQPLTNNIVHNLSNYNNITGNTNVMHSTAATSPITAPASSKLTLRHGPGPREALTSLGLLCLVSLLLALLSLIFLLKISPNVREEVLTRNVSSDDFIIVYDVTLALCALSLSLNLCCLLVCAIQFLFAVKLLRSPMFDGRDNKYLEKSSASRTCAVSGFFISIPVFLTGIILYTFNHFHSTPAIITSVLIGLGIVFCGGAMVHNVFVWQKEKTISYRSVPLNVSVLTPNQLPPLIGTQLFNKSYAPTSATATSAASMTVPARHALPVYAPQSHCLPLQAPQPSMIQLQLQQPTSVTPVSPNHSHGSFNPLLCNGTNSAGISSSFLVRPATATPPTPKLPVTNCVKDTLGRPETSGSVSPGIPNALDMSNMTISLHELSTLV